MNASSPEARIRLHLLGTPRITRADGTDAGLALGKPLAALCFIALESTRVDRDDLVRVLWSGSPPTRARQSVRQALWMLRKAGGDAIVVEPDGILTLGPEVVTDIADLSEALGVGDLDAAWELWQGGLLQRLAVPDSPAFQGWADEVRSRWEVRMGEALLARAEAENDPAERLRWLERALEVQAYSEALHVARVRALLEQRDIESAEEALAHARAVVDEPSPGTFEELTDRLRALRRTRFAADGTGEDTLLVPEFVGRAEEFSRLAALWRSALSGRPRSVALVGPAGIGKTRLAEEFLALAETDGARIVGVKAVEAERTLELGVAAALVRHLLRLPGGAGISAASAEALGHLVPSSAGGMTTVGQRPAPAAMADAVEDLVEAVAHEVPLVLLIDDLQWVDPASRTLILRMARTLRGARALVLFTARTQEGDAGALRALQGLEAEGRGAVITLAGLTHGEVQELVTLLTDDPVDEALMDFAGRLAQSSAGTPLHIVGTLLLLHEQGLLIRKGSGWHLDRRAFDAPLPTPDSLAIALTERLDRLDDETLQAAQILAVHRAGLTPRRFAALLEGDRAHADALIRTLMEQGLVRRGRSGRVELSHDSVADRLRARALERAVPSEAPPVHRPWSTLVAAALVALVVSVGALAVGGRVVADGVAADAGDDVVAEPFGGGTIYVVEGDRILVLEVHDADAPRLTLVDSLPSGAQRGFRVSTPPARDAMGRTVLAGSLFLNEHEAPEAALLVGDSLIRLTYTPGDDYALALNPALTAVLLARQEDDAAEYALRYEWMDLATGATIPAPVPTTASYKPLGWDRVRDAQPLFRNAERDSLFFWRPDDAVVDTVALNFPITSDVTLCGATGDVLVRGVERGEVARLVLHERNAGREDPLPIRASGISMCSPDGSGVLEYRLDRDGGRLVLSDRSGVVLSEFALTAGDHMWWVPEPGDVVSEIRFDQAHYRIPHGGVETVSAQVLGRDGPMDAELRWHSTNPVAVSTDARGRIFGNRPGSAWLVATAPGWVRDSVAVEVMESSDGPQLLVSDPFTRLDTAVWRITGTPEPRMATLEGEEVLEFRGDGRFADYISTRDAWSLRSGAVLSFEFFLTLTDRRSKQSVTACLRERTEAAEADDTGAFVGIGQSMCFVWPFGELADFDPGAVSLGVGNVAFGGFDLGDRDLSGRWVNVRLQVQTDGTVALYIDGEQMGTHPVPLDVRTDGGWEIYLAGKAVDTRALMRNLRLWEGGPEAVAMQND